MIALIAVWRSAANISSLTAWSEAWMISSVIGSVPAAAGQGARGRPAPGPAPLTRRRPRRQVGAEQEPGAPVAEAVTS